MKRRLSQVNSNPATHVGQLLDPHESRPYVSCMYPLSAPPPVDILRAADLIRRRRVTVLSGAGISTESGIPDYRGPDGPRRKTSPIQYRDFVGSEATRARYWARSAIGWPHFSAAQPNAGHTAVARLEKEHVVSGIITQNVDGLHQAAGSANVIELHGALAEVVCLQCEKTESRHALQERLLAMNPEWQARAHAVAPDGDADLPDEVTRDFRVPTCLCCGGTIKPNVILFGENVPRSRVDSAVQLVDRADVLLVLGSSLAVFSGFRFVDYASRAGTPIVIVNVGPTRGDRLATVRIDAPIGTVLPEIVDHVLAAE